LTGKPSQGTPISFDAPDLMSGALAVGVGVYLAAVLINGNLSDLGSSLMHESGYLEFLIALFVLSLLASFGPTSEITQVLIVIALIGLAFRLATNTPKVLTALQNFGAGQTDLFGTFSAIVGG
jgi:hypothetical protein